MHVQNARSRRCSRKMERTRVNLSDVPSFQRITMESRLHSRGRFSQEPQLRNFSKKFKDLEGQRIISESFSDRIIFMSMFKDIDLDKIGTLAISIREKSKCMRQDSLTDTGYSWVPEKKARYQGYAVNCGKCELHVSPIVEEFENSGNPVFKGASPLGPRTLKMRSGRNTIHLSGEFDNIDFLFRTVHAANQLCFYGAVIKLCGKQPKADSGKASKGQTRKCSKNTQRNLDQAGRTQVIGCFSECFRTWKISSRFLS